MSVFVEGVGAISPVGPNAEQSWAALCHGAEAARAVMPQAMADRAYYYCPVPRKFLSEAARYPRLRRSGTISLLGTAASLDALADASLKQSKELGGGIAVVFAICSGGVDYTRRFYDEIARGGANSASPLLFPETVFNAAASHVSALLGVDGQSYTLVGDSSIGLSAIHFGCQLLEMQPELEHCLVVGTEETDWLLAEAFASWKMAERERRFEVYGKKSGTVFGEGSAAVVLGRNGTIKIANSHPGQSFFSIHDAGEVALQLFPEIAGSEPVDFIVASANGTFADEAEQRVFSTAFPETPVYCPKPATGESLGASTLFQTVCAVLALRHQKLPGTLQAGWKLASVNREARTIEASRAFVSAIGFNQQVNGLVLGYAK
jgi:3-oxoacyl-(acyl-carrier-protein) synthase